MTNATITLNAADALADIYDARRTKFWVIFNTDSGRVTDADGVSRLGAGEALPDAAGIVTLTGIPVPSGATNPTNFQVMVCYDAPAKASNQRDVKRERGDFGWMTVTGDANLKDLEAEQYAPPNYLVGVTGELAEYVTDAEAARDAAVDISNISTPDSLVQALVKNTGGAGPLTSAALSASFVPAVTISGAGIDPTGAADSRAAIQAKLDTLADGGMAYFPPGIYRITSPGLDLDDTSGIQFVGPGLGIDRQKDPSCELRYTSAGTGHAITARRSEGFTVRGMAVRYGSATYTGRLIDVRGDNATPSYRPSFKDVLLGGTGGSTVNAETVVDLGNTVEASFDDYVIARAVSGIIGYDGASTYCFAAHFGHGRFVDLVADAVRNPHGSWTFHDAVLENAIDGTPAGFVNDPDHLVAGLTFVGGGFYDASQPGAWIDLYGNGVTVLASRIEMAAGITFARLRTTDAIPFNGFTVRDAQIIGPSGATFAEHLGAGYVADYTVDGNSFLNGIVDNSPSLDRIRYSARPKRVTVVDATSTLNPADGVVIAKAGGPITLTLPDSLDTALVLKGTQITVRNVATGAFAVTLAPVGGQKIDGAFSVTIPPGGSRTLVSDGTASPGGWYTIESHGLTRRGSTGGISNGSDIAHGLGVVPTSVTLSCSDNGVVVQPVSVGSVNITVGALLNTGGPIGTPTTVYWSATV